MLLTSKSLSTHATPSLPIGTLYRSFQYFSAFRSVLSIKPALGQHATFNILIAPF